jgi:hypothetical protein
VVSTDARPGVRSTFGPVSLAYEPGLRVGFGADRPNGGGCVRASAACGARTRFSLQAGGFSRRAELLCTPRALRAEPSLAAEVSLVELAGILHRGRRYTLRATANAYELTPHSSGSLESS